MSNIVDLFREYDKADQELIQAKKAVEEKLKARSSIVQSILEANEGGKKLRRKTATGVVQNLTIVKRGEVYFFRGASDDGEVIDTSDK